MHTKKSYTGLRLKEFNMDLTASADKVVDDPTACDAVIDDCIERLCKLKGWGPTMAVELMAKLGIWSDHKLQIAMQKYIAIYESKEFDQ